MPDDDVYSGSRQPYSPYKQSRSTLRKQFGSRAIDASAQPSERNTNTIAAGVGAMGGKTPAHNWAGFFRPVTPETSMFSAGTMGVTGGDKAATLAATAPTPIPTPSVASPALPPAPVDYLKAAHQRSTEFWKNAQGGRIATPQSFGAPVQAGTSFRSKFGTGSVISGSDRLLRRMMANTEV